MSDKEITDKIRELLREKQQLLSEIDTKFNQRIPKEKRDYVFNRIIEIRDELNRLQFHRKMRGVMKDENTI